MVQLFKRKNCFSLSFFFRLSSGAEKSIQRHLAENNFTDWHLAENNFTDWHLAENNFTDRELTDRQ